MTTTLKKTKKRVDTKPLSFEEFELKMKLPDEKITDDEIMKEVKKVRYATKSK